MPILFLSICFLGTRVITNEASRDITKYNLILTLCWIAQAVLEKDSGRQIEMSSNEEVFTQINATANVVDNKKRLLFVQDSSALVLGLVAGFLQIESVHGFIWFLILYNLINVIYIVWICQLQPGKFYQSPLQDIFFESFFREITGFVMAWTFGYALIG